MYSLEQSCEDDHFFLSSMVSCNCCLPLIERPQPAVNVPNRENALFTIGELGTLLALQNIRIRRIVKKTNLIYLPNIERILTVYFRYLAPAGNYYFSASADWECLVQLEPKSPLQASEVNQNRPKFRTTFLEIPLKNTNNLVIRKPPMHRSCRPSLRYIPASDT